MIQGLGIDIIEVKKIERAINRWGDHFLNHVFCPEEIAYSQKHKYPSQHFAARFAAKEAIMKSIGDNENINWKDIKIMNHSNGKPYCVFNKESLNYKVLISLSHSSNYAVANAIITS